MTTGLNVTPISLTGPIVPGPFTLRIAARWISSILAIGLFLLLTGCDFEFDDDSCRDFQSCTWGCPAGGCNWLCTDEANCSANCEGGDCRLTCEAAADCLFDCPGGGCQFTCRGDAACDFFCPTGDCNYTCDASATCF